MLSFLNPIKAAFFFKGEKLEGIKALKGIVHFSEVGLYEVPVNSKCIRHRERQPVSRTSSFRNRGRELEQSLLIKELFNQKET